MRIILDTSVLWDKTAMRHLRAEPGIHILPVVAFAERARQFTARGWPLSGLWDLLAAAQVTVEAMDETCALRRTLAIVDDASWGRLSRDAFIAGHVETDDVLWTRNVADFRAVGLRMDQIQDTAKFSPQP